MARLGTCSAQAAAGPCASGDHRTLLQRCSHSKHINDSVDFGPGRW